MHGPRVAEILDRMEARHDTLCASAFAAAEILVGLYKSEERELAAGVERFFQSPELRVIDFRLSTARRYAEIRSRVRVSPADAIHLASAAEAGVDLFLTHDRRLKGKLVPGIHFIADLEADLL